MSGIALVASVLLKETNFRLSSRVFASPFLVPSPRWPPFGRFQRKLCRAAWLASHGPRERDWESGRFYGSFFIGWLKKSHDSVAVPFTIFGIGLLVAAGALFSPSKIAAAFHINPPIETILMLYPGG